MSTKAVFENVSKLAGGVSNQSLSINADFITDYAFAAQGREFRNEAAPSVGFNMGMPS